MRKFLLACLILTFFAGMAQEKTLSLQEATGLSAGIYPANLAQLGWIGESNRYKWVADTLLLQTDAATYRQDTVTRLSLLNGALKQAGAEPLKRMPVITIEPAGTLRFLHEQKIWRFDPASASLLQMNSYPKEAENLDLDEKGLKVAYTRGGSLYLSVGGKEIPVALSEGSGISYGASNVHRNEWGIGKGTFWSPGGNYLAFYRMDEKEVTDYPLVNAETRIAEASPVKYPMAGMKSHRVTLGIFDVAKKSVTWLQTESDGKDRITGGIEYLTNITWSPDEKYIYLAALNRDQNHMALCKYNPLTGALDKVLFTESDTAYVEPLHGPVFLNKDPGRFVWESPRDGYNHLYLYDDQGNLIHQLTSGPWVVTDLKGSDAAGEKLYFLCNKGNPLDRCLYYTDLRDYSLHPLITLPGTHSAQISHDGSFILDSYSRLDIAREISLLDGSGNLQKTLLENKDPLKEYRLGKTTLFSLPGENGEDLWCRMITPPEMDPARKYPVIIYVYGGPHSQLITNTWLGGAGFFLNFLAQQGFVVFTLDNRGTADRGEAFEQAIFRKLGQAEAADQMRGVAYLKSLPYVDSTRIGINGWSYGGFMTLTLVTDYPGTFKAAVAGGPVTDWKYYEVMYGERYMDTPESNPEGYLASSLLNKAGKINGRVLIIHGYQDATVVPQNSLTFLKKCIDEGKQIDFFLYPGHEHNVRGKDRVHLNQKILQYFNDFL